MIRLSELALRFLGGPGPALLLALAWPTLRFAGRPTRRPAPFRTDPRNDAGHVFGRSGADDHRAGQGDAALRDPSPPAAPAWHGGPDARTLAALSIVGAAHLLIDLVLRLPGLAPWQAPTDRLLGGLFVCAVAVAVRSSVGQGAMASAHGPGDRSRRGRALSAVGGDARAPLALVAGAAALVAWALAAPGWAAAAGAGAASATSRAVLADVLLAAAALGLAVTVAARGDGGADAERSAVTLPALGALALGSALQALWPMPGAAVLWRAGLLAAGVGTGVAVTRRDGRWDASRARARTAMVVRTWASAAREAVPAVGAAAAAVLDRARRHAGRTWRAARGAAMRPGDAVGRGGPGGSARARLALASTVGGALGGALRQLDAAVLYAGLIEDEAVRFWAVTPSGALQELYRRPLGQLAAVKRALQSGAGALGSRTEARDIDDLYSHLGLPFDGPVLLAAGGRPARTILIAGSAYGPWRRDDPERLAAHAAELAARLAELDEPTARSRAAHAQAPPSPSVVPAATVDDVARLRAEVAALHSDMVRFGARLDGLEQRFVGHPPMSDPSAGAAHVVPSPAASYLARLEAYQRLLEPLPWGVVVCDPDGRVILANTAVRRLLVGAALLPGHRIDVPGPGARTLVRSLRDASSTLQGGRVPLGAMDAVVRIEPIDRPNWRQRNRLGATLVVMTAADAAAGGEAVLVDLLEALRDPLVDLRLQGESLDAEVRMPLPDLMRHLAVLDGHAAGLRAVLGALVAQRSLATQHHRPEMGAVDVGDLGATTERSLRDLFALRGIRFRGVRGIVPSNVTVDVRLLEHVALAVVTGAVSTASWGSHMAVHVRHEAIVQGDPASAIVVVIDMLDGGLTPMTSRRPLDEAALAAHPAALRVGHALAERGFPGCEAWFARRTPEDQRLQLCLRLPVGRAA